VNVTLDMKIAMSAKNDRDYWRSDEMSRQRRAAETDNSRCCYASQQSDC
jgi:hypothetical protein